MILPEKRRCGTGGEKTERHIPDATGWQAALDACPEAAGLQLERAKLHAGEPWCVAPLAGLQFYDYGSPGLDGTLRQLG